MSGAVLGGISFGLRRDPLTVATLAALVLLVALAVFGPWFAPYDPLATHAIERLSPPSLTHPCGTDQLGRDICTRIVYAARLDLAIAIGAVLIAMLLGGALGAVAGFFGGWIDRFTVWLTDTIMAFPLFILAMGIVAALGNSVANIVWATAVVNIPFYARMMRTEINQRREAGFVEAARVSGNGRMRILMVHLVPCAVPPIVVQMSLTMGWAILNAAALSFIGLGVRPPTPEWGIMVAEGASFIITGEWWVALFPGAMLMGVVLCFNLLGDGMRDLLDARERR